MNDIEKLTKQIKELQRQQYIGFKIVAWILLLNGVLLFHYSFALAAGMVAMTMLHFWNDR